MDADGSALPRLSGDLSSIVKTLREVRPEIFERPRANPVALGYLAWKRGDSSDCLGQVASDALLGRVALAIAPSPKISERRRLIAEVAQRHGIEDGRTLEPSAAAELSGISGVAFEAWSIETQIAMLRKALQASPPAEDASPESGSSEPAIAIRSLPKWQPDDVPDDCRDQIKKVPCTAKWAHGRFGLTGTHITRAKLEPQGKLGRANVYRYRDLTDLVDSRAKAGHDA